MWYLAYTSEFSEILKHIKQGVR